MSSRSSKPLGAGKAVRPTGDHPEDGAFLAWLLGQQERAAGEAPRPGDDPVPRLAAALAACVADGCVSSEDRLSVFAVAAHIGSHAGELPGWIESALSTAVDRHRDSLSSTAVDAADRSVPCGECGVWRTRRDFELTGGCCSRRAVEHGNRWAGDDPETEPAELSAAHTEYLRSHGLDDDPAGTEAERAAAEWGRNQFNIAVQRERRRRAVQHRLEAEDAPRLRVQGIDELIKPPPERLM